jgi:hypothetical protein
MEKALGERLLGISKNAFEVNFKADLRETGCEDEEWKQVTQDCDQ